MWATAYGVVYYVFGATLSKLSTAIDVTLGVAGAVILIGFVVWTRRKEFELRERAEKEIEGSVAQELGQEDSAA